MSTQHLTPEDYQRERARLVAERGEVVTKAAELARAGTGRVFSPGEEVEALNLKARAEDADRRLAELDADQQRRRVAAERERADRKAADAEIMEAIKALGEGIGPIDGRPRLARSQHASDWAPEVADRLAKAAEQRGVKALATGSIDVPAPLLAEVQAFPTAPRRITDLLVDRVPLTSNSYSYLRQVARDNHAAPVPDGSLKPTSTFTVTEIEDRARVYAHLSEPVPERYLADVPALVRFLESEMENGVLAAIENSALNGDGQDEQVTGLLHTSGTLAQPFAGDLVTTLRRARTALEMVHETPNAWALHPADLEAIDLLREDGAGGGFLVGGASPAGTNVFGDLPRVASPLIPAGTAILGDWTCLFLAIREEVRLDADRSGENFTRNLVTLRAEGRYGVGVTRPQGFVTVHLTA